MVLGYGIRDDSQWNDRAVLIVPFGSCYDSIMPSVLAKVRIPALLLAFNFSSVATVNVQTHSMLSFQYLSQEQMRIRVE